MEHINAMEEELGISVMQSLAILSSHEHRSTSNWKLVEEQRFKNGRLDETHVYVESFYEKPDEDFEPVKMLIFEAEAIAKAYVVEDLENQLSEGESGQSQNGDD